jgi:hypothetical protein
MVLVVHDVSNEYSHETIDSEVLKCLFSHPEKESILVLNKTDNLKNKKKLLDLVTSLTGGQLNGKEFMPKEKKLKFNRNTLSDSDYEALFAKTAQKMNLKLEDDKSKKIYKLLEELKACEEYLIKNQSKITIDGDSNNLIADLAEMRINEEKLDTNYVPAILNPTQESNLVDSIVKNSVNAHESTMLRSIEDISPEEFKKDLMLTTDWHMYYKKLSSLSSLVRGKTYWPYFNQVFIY